MTASAAWLAIQAERPSPELRRRRRRCPLNLGLGGAQNAALVGRDRAERPTALHRRWFKDPADREDASVVASRPRIVSREKAAHDPQLLASSRDGSFLFIKEHERLHARLILARPHRRQQLSVALREPDLDSTVNQAADQQAAMPR